MQSAEKRGAEKGEERPIANVKTPRTMPKLFVVDCTIAKLVENMGAGNKYGLFIPKEQRDAIVSTYAGYTMRDLDTLHGVNAKIGGMFDNCFQSMMHWMNETDGNLSDQMEKLKRDPELHDQCNLVQSAVRSRRGEEVWYYR